MLQLLYFLQRRFLSFSAAHAGAPPAVPGRSPSPTGAAWVLSPEAAACDPTQVVVLSHRKLAGHSPAAAAFTVGS